MLGVTENKILGDADRVLQQIGEKAGVGETFYKTDVAVYFGDEPRNCRSGVFR